MRYGSQRALRSRTRVTFMRNRVTPGAVDVGLLVRSPPMFSLARAVVSLLVAAVGLVGSANAQSCCTGSVSTYCTAGTTVQGCVPQISGVGVPSMNATSGFDIIVDSVPTQKMGLIFYGLSAITQPQPWALGSSSYLCVFYPVNRTGAQNSAGHSGACDGELRVNFNAWRAANPGALGSPFAPGEVIHAQGWFRDSGAAKGTNLSDALTFTLCDGSGDAVPPVITTCAPNQSVGTAIGCQGVVPDFTASVAASDNCSPLVLTQSPTAGTTASLGSTAVTITARDPSGNTSQCVATLTVTDTSGPIITTCAGNQTVAGDSNCQGIVPNFTAGVVATDSCGGAVTLSQSPAAGTTTFSGLSAIAVTITATDLAGNTSSCTANLTVTLSGACPTPPGMVPIPAGTFTMGSDAAGGVPYFGNANTQPMHLVTISYSFSMGANEVTQAQYAALMGSNPSYFGGNPYLPVEQVSWFDARAYCAALTAQQAALGAVPAGYEYRLPTEAEWEYACRAGTTTEFNTGASLVCSQARFWHSYHFPSSDCGSSSPVAVGSYGPNAWSLYDMHGNVYEWCLDSPAAYAPAAVTDPFVTGGPARVFRGGSWDWNSNNCRSAHRLGDVPFSTMYDVGFRVVLAPILVP
jgi:formylglycine-generating enzyme required for sulfatase activity